jgi:hypothetical protein
LLIKLCRTPNNLDFIFILIRMTPTIINIVSSAIFAVAVIHTFSTKFFEHLAHKYPNHSGIWHLLGEVEVVFGFWAMVLVSFFFVYSGHEATIAYLEKLNFTEPLFVFVIMIIAASKPVLEFCLFLVLRVTALLPVKKSVGFLWVTLTLCALTRFIYYRACCHDGSRFATA